MTRRRDVVTSVLRHVLPGVVAAFGLSLATAAAASGQGLAVRVAPELSSMRWSAEVGLEAADLTGGSLSLGFGRYVGLRAGYVQARGLATSLVDAGLSGTPTIPLLENTVDADLFATDVQVRLMSSRLAPLLVGTGGVLDLSPQGRPRVRQIFVGYGAGLEYRLTDWLDAQWVVKDVRFRLDRSTLAGDTLTLGVPADSTPDAVRGSLAVGFSLGARIGGGTSGRADALDDEIARLYAGDAERLMVPLEVRAGLLTFDADAGVGDQTTIGVRTGIDLGPYFGLRGSYGRGVTSGLDAFVGLSTWAGEAQFNLGRVTRLSPHLILGFGEMHFEEDFRDRAGARPPDQSAVILGVGVGLPLAARSRMLVSVRDYVTAAGSFADVASTGDLRHNFGLDIGLSYLLVGRRATSGPSPSLTPAPGPPSPAVVREPTPDPADTTAPRASPGASSTAADSAAAAVDPAAVDAGYHSDRTVTLPIPKEGELYIRYGPGTRTTPSGAVVAQVDGAARSPAGGAAALDSAALVEVIRSEVARSRQSPEGGLTATDLEALEARLLARLRGANPNDARQDPALEELSRRVQELASLVRDQIDRPVSRPEVVTLVPVGTAAELALVEPRPFFRRADFRVGTTTVRDGRPGPMVSTGLSVGHLGNRSVRPVLYLEAGRSSVRTQFGGSSVFGAVASIGAAAGLAFDVRAIGPVVPHVGVGLNGVAGGTEGDTDQDAELMDQLYGGFAMGPTLELGWTWRGRTRPAGMDLTGALRRVWAGSRSRWSFEVGLGLRRAERAASSAQIAVPGSPPPDVQARPDSPAADESVPEAGPVFDSEAHARLDALEAALASERAARVRSETAAREAAEEAAAMRARADSLADASARAAALRRAEDARLEADRRLQDELESLVGILDHVVAVRRSERGLEVVLGAGVFSVGSRELPERARAQVARIAAVLRMDTTHSVLVDGHTDSTGAPELNLEISRERAEAVRAVLLESGLDANRVSVQASGSNAPLTRADDAEGRARNRRVEIVLLGLDGR